MLKFLEEPHNIQSSKSGVKLLPAMVYGHTHDSVPQMLNKYSVYYQPTDKKSSKTHTPGFVKLPPCVKEEFSITTQHKNEKQKNFHRKYQSHQQLPFAITQGQFCNFLDRHKNYQTIGILHKQKQEDLKMDKQKQSLSASKWNKSTNPKSNSISIETSQQKSSNFNSINSIKNSSMASVRVSSLPVSRSSSVCVLQKDINLFHLKARREEFAKTLKMERDVKRKTLCGDFALPSQGAAHQLFFLWKNKKQIKFNRDERKQIDLDLDKFEKRMEEHFK